MKADTEAKDFVLSPGGDWVVTCLSCNANQEPPAWTARFWTCRACGAQHDHDAARRVPPRKEQEVSEGRYFAKGDVIRINGEVAQVTAAQSSSFPDPALAAVLDRAVRYEFALRDVMAYQDSIGQRGEEYRIARAALGLGDS